MLYDRGLLLLDDPVSKYIPSFAAMTRVSGSSEEATPCSTAITVRHLLNHTSGLTYGFFDGTGPAGVVDRLHRALPRVGATSTKGCDALAKCPLAFEPGSAFRYSNATAVLGRVVTVAAGVPLDKFFQNEVCEKLEMVDTAYFVPPEKQNRVATAYTRITVEEEASIEGSSVADGWKAAAKKKLVRMPDAAQECPDSQGGFIAADGGLFTTAKDWGKFMAMLCDKGAHLLSQSAWEVMVAPSTPNLATDFNSHWADPADTAGPYLCANHATGGFAHSLCGEVVVDSSLAGCGPCSNGTFGWEGIFTTKFMIDPMTGVSWAAFSQVHPCWEHNLKAELGPLIFTAMNESYAKL